MLSIRTPPEVAHMLRERLRERRLEYEWSREVLAARSGVKAATIKRFETTGEIALSKFLALCFTLHALEEFEAILKPTPPTSLAEITKLTKKRKRGKRSTS